MCTHQPRWGKPPKPSLTSHETRSAEVGGLNGKDRSPRVRERHGKGGFRELSHLHRRERLAGCRGVEGGPPDSPQQAGRDHGHIMPRCNIRTSVHLPDGHEGTGGVLGKGGGHERKPTACIGTAHAGGDSGSGLGGKKGAGWGLGPDEHVRGVPHIL